MSRDRRFGGGLYWSPRFRRIVFESNYTFDILASKYCRFCEAYRGANIGRGELMEELERCGVSP